MDTLSEITRRFSLYWSLLLILTVVLTACTGNGNGLDENGKPLVEDDPDTEQPIGLFIEVQEIFSVNCALSGCHTGAIAAASLNLAADNAYNNIVNVASGEQPERMRVLPFDADNSYLVNKIRGDANIIGAQMPRGQQPLSDLQIQSIVDWVDAGAEPPTKQQLSAYKSWPLISEGPNFNSMNDGVIHFSAAPGAMRRIYSQQVNFRQQNVVDQYPAGSLLVNEISDQGVIIELTAMLKINGKVNDVENSWQWFILEPTTQQIKRNNLDVELSGKSLMNNACKDCHIIATMDFGSDFVFTPQDKN